MQVPEGKQIIVTGPDPHPVEVGIGPTNLPITHEEADVLMAYHMMEEISNGTLDNQGSV